MKGNRQQHNNIHIVYLPPVLAFGQGERSSPVTVLFLPSHLTLRYQHFFHLGIMVFGSKMKFRSGSILLLHFQRCWVQSGSWLKVTQPNDNSGFLTSWHVMSYSCPMASEIFLRHFLLFGVWTGKHFEMRILKHTWILVGLATITFESSMT